MEAVFPTCRLSRERSGAYMVHSYLGNIRDREVTKIIDMVCLSQLQRCNYLVNDTVLFNKFSQFRRGRELEAPKRRVEKLTVKKAQWKLNQRPVSSQSKSKA